MWWIFHCIAYVICLTAVVVFILPSLYWAVRAPWKPKKPGEKRPPRSRITSKYLFRAALAAFLIQLVLVNI